MQHHHRDARDEEPTGREVQAQLPHALQIVAFALIFLALQWSWGQMEGSAVERAVIHDGTARPAAWLVNLLSPGVEAVAAGSRIKAAGGGINVLNGCEGLDILFLMTAAFCVFWTGWRRWVTGFLLGAGFVWTINQMRIVSLFFANRHDKELFAILHGTVAPLILITLVTIAFALFVRSSPVPRQEGH